MNTMHRITLTSLSMLSVLVSASAAEPIAVVARSRAVPARESDPPRVTHQNMHLDPAKTAIVICDMWNQHWCQGATRRVAEMAPRMNDVVSNARDRGVLIIHCPSGTMDFYKDTPQRQLAQAAPVVAPKVPLQGWCSLDRNQEAPLPIDDSDGGCDDQPVCSSKPPYPWTRQIAALDIKKGDAITDSAEAYYLLRQRGIENVIVMGVHLNMCVLGRPFGIRQLSNQGLNVLLMRDLTDTMYNSRRKPFVPHCAGTDLMIEHVEQYWCPTITSVAFLGGEPSRFSEDKRPRLVFLIGEDEYKTWETLPAFVQRELPPARYNVTVVHQDANEKQDFPGLTEALSGADLLFVSVRRRALPKEQLDAVRRHLESGKPLVGIRTTSHAFDARGLSKNSRDPVREEWPRFDPEVLGGNYHGHYGAGPKTTITIAPGAAAHPILAGLDPGQLVGNGSLYRASPLAESAQPLLIGTIPGQSPEPVAWTHRYGPKHAPVFYTSLGSPEDFEEPLFRQLLLQGIRWALDQAVPAGNTEAAGAK